jgi:hypothetical protein
LKIKSKHLALESGVIRHEENKLQKQIAWCRKNNKTDELNKLVDQLNSLSVHRRVDVRNENRATFLARAFLSGKPYLKFEARRNPEREYQFANAILPRVLVMVQKYGSRRTTKENVETWLKA